MAKTIEKIGRVSSASVAKHTRKTWDEWVKILDIARARTWTHRELVALLKQKYRLTPWWQQCVAIGYETHIGKRIEGRNEKGLYSLTVTKTLPIGQKRAWKLLASREGTAVWLKPFSEFELKPKAEFEVYGGIFGQVRTMKAPLRARLSWQESEWAKPSVIQLYVIPRPGEKSVFVLQHEGLPAEEWREKMRAHWKQAAADLASYLAAEKKAGPRKGAR